MRYTDRLVEADIVPSVGSRGDSYDNAMAESIIGLYKRECVRHDGPFRTVDELELATLSWVDWWNRDRLHGELGHVPPIEFEEHHYRRISAQQQPLSGEPSLH
jgi:putative transposase